ncbi:MAG: hypothetical protein HY921_11480 [Elusimicrobia bacterium]|nr:hypothetical protein [Elusimicrobiota bacterium]
MELERRAGRGQKVGRPGSARLSYAPVFRDDIYPEGYKGHEFRQFHKRDEELLSAMDEFSRILAVSGDLTPFEPFAEIKLLSPDLPAQRARELDIFIDAAAWRDFFQRIGEAAEEKIKRSVLNPSIRIGAAPLAERFFYPLRDWSRHPVIQNLPPTEKPQALLRIERASRGFIRRVNSLVERERDGGASSEGLIEPLQTAVARWGYEANLSEYFQTFKNNILTAGGARGPPLAAAPFVRSISQVMAHPHEMREFSNGKEYVYYKDGGELDLKSKAYQDFLDSSVEVYYSPGYEHVFLRIGRKSYSFPNYIPKEFNPRIKKEKGFMFQVGKERIQEVLSGIDGLHEAMRPFFDIDSRELEISRLPDDRLSLDGRIVNTSAEIVDENGEVFLKDKNGFAWPLVKKGEKLFIQSLSCATSATYIMRKYFGIDIGFKYGAKSLKEALSRGNPQGRSPDAIIDYQKPVLFYETTAFITVVSFLIAAVILGGFMLLTWFAPPLPPGGGGGGGGSGVGGLL